MDTDKCRALLTALEEGTMAQAAEKLGYTPSGISRMIASLEQETGFKLLHRQKEGVQATKECEMLLPIMRELVFQEERYKQLASSLQGLEQGCINIGIAHYDIFLEPLTKIMAEFRSMHPSINFKIVEGISSELAEALAERRLDFCIISKREGLTRWLPLVRDELVLMLPPDDPLAEKNSIPLELLATSNYIDIHGGSESDNSLCLANNKVKIENQFAGVNDCNSAKIMVEAGMGVAMLNNVIAKTLRGNIVFRPLFPPQYVEIGIATHSLEDMSPAMSKFIDYIEKYFVPNFKN